MGRWKLEKHCISRKHLPSSCTEFNPTVHEVFSDLGWRALQGHSLGDGAPDPRFILLHQDVGVVLLDAAPDTVPDPVVRLRRRLRAARFERRFPGHLPIIYCSLTEQDLWRLSVTLDSAFRRKRPMELQDDDWMPALEALCLQPGPDSQSRQRLRPPLPADA
ncbi:hypothetical protein ACFQU7_15050 [Pseudoroseomonas wenyumeiae]